MKTSLRSTRIAILATAAGLALGCIPTGDAPARGAAEFTIVGSAAVLNGTTTSDGWSLAFERSLVIISDFEFGKTFPPPGQYPFESCNYDVESPPSSIFSLHTAATLSYRGFDAGPCQGVSINIGNFEERGNGLYSSPWVLQPGVTSDDVSAIAAVNAAALVEGTAQRGAKSVRFSLAMAIPSNGNFNRQFNRCYGTVDGARRNGVEIPSYDRDAVLLEFHAERLFRSHLPSADHASDDDTLEFTAFAAAATDVGDRDGTVTVDESRAIALSSLVDKTGRYDASGHASADTLGDFLTLQFDDIWGFRGDGHCDAFQ